MKKAILLSTLFTLLLLITSGCLNNQEGVANVPFDVLDKNDFTVEELRNKVNSPEIAMVDDENLLKQAYKKIRKNGMDEKFFLTENELALIIIRGSKGNCANADLTIRQISKESGDLKVEVVIDEGVNQEDVACEAKVNPYSIVKLRKDDADWKDSVKVHLVDANSKQTLDKAELNDLPAALK